MLRGFFLLWLLGAACGCEPAPRDIAFIIPDGAHGAFRVEVGGGEVRSEGVAVPMSGVVKLERGLTLEEYETAEFFTEGGKEIPFGRVEDAAAPSQEKEAKAFLVGREGSGDIYFIGHEVDRAKYYGYAKIGLTKDGITDRWLGSPPKDSR